MRKILSCGVIALALLSACSEQLDHGQFNNGIYAGTVLNARRTQDVNWGGIGTMLTGAALNGRQMSSSGMSNSGIEYVVSLENGQTVTITQDEQGQVFYPGDKVNVQMGNNYARVVPQNIERRRRYSESPQQF